MSTLGQVAMLKSGGTPSKGTSAYWNGSIPWLTPKDMNGYNGTTQDCVTAAAIGNGTRCAPAGSIFMAVRGMSLHNEIRIIRPNNAIAFNQDIKAIIPKSVDPDFLYFTLVSQKNLLLSQVEAAGHGTGVLPTGRLMDLPILRFSTVEEAAIGATFRAIDDKIDLNRRMNETLEAIARAIFKDWMTRIGDQLERCRVSELIAKRIMLIGDGYRAKNDEMGVPGLPFLRARELNNGFDTEGAEILYKFSVARASEKISRDGDVAFTSKGTIGRFARVSEQTPKFVYSPQVCFWRSTDPDRLRSSILYLWMVSDELRSQIEAAAGQTDMAPYVSLRDQRAMKMPVFGQDQHAVADSIDPLLNLQNLNTEESRTLAKMRALLLPKLMSGQIRIREAEKIVGAAA